MRTSLIRFIPLLVLAHGSSAAEEFVHPGIAHSRAAIEFVKGKLKAGEQPWAGEWEKLKDSRYADLDWKPRPRAHVERGVRNRPDIGGTDFMRDADTAYTHALHWTFSGEAAHARKAAEIILNIKYAKGF